MNYFRAPLAPAGARGARFSLVCLARLQIRRASQLKKEPGRLRVAAHNLGEPMAVRPRVLLGGTAESDIAAGTVWRVADARRDAIPIAVRIVA